MIDGEFDCISRILPSSSGLLSSCCKDPWGSQPEHLEQPICLWSGRGNSVIYGYCTMRSMFDEIVHESFEVCIPLVVKNLAQIGHAHSPASLYPNTAAAERYP